MGIREDNIYLGKKNNLEAGYVLAPYIISTSVTVISDNSEKIKNEVIQENRDRAIDSLLEDKEYLPMKVEDHPDYNGFNPSKNIKNRYSTVNTNSNFYSTIKKGKI